MEPIETVLAKAAATGKPGSPPLEIGARLQSARGFPAGWWHADDLDGAHEVIAGCLTDLGVAPSLLSAAVLAGITIDPTADEDGRRRRQIAEAAGALNIALATAGSSYRFHQFADGVAGWESDEPVWLYLTDDERQLLLERGLLREPVS